MLTDSQLQEFDRDGCLVVRGVLDDEALGNLRAEFAARADDILRRAEAAGKMPRKTGGDISERLSRLICAAPGLYQHLDISLPMDDHLSARIPAWREIFGDDWREEAGVFAGESVHALLTHPKLAAIARQLTGDNPVASPVQHIRVKPPQHLLPQDSVNDATYARTLWHQDEAVVHEGARGANILTVWAAVSDATLENGCLICAPGSHLEKDDPRRADFGLKTHCPGRKFVGDIYIPEELIPEESRRPLQAKAGDIVLLHRRTAHGAGGNMSDSIRWSFDLRFQQADTPTGRECFPAFPLSQTGKAGAQRYRRQWLDARDAILCDDIRPSFNTRWNKYSSAPLCA
ncbi:MAG: phytanoyl-CoA dioxygenase family protein [Gammaproteobacteria bacterium]